MKVPWPQSHGRRAFLGLVLAALLFVAPIGLAVIIPEVAWSLAWMFYFALVPSALLYSASQALQLRRK